MNGNGREHPARSVDFLSRLHDGELEPAERAHFEAHRAHCGECRRAAVEFEDAISLFRSARSNPPRADLAARILRKVQTTNRPRTPFGPRFRIDLGWAALLATVLLALMITTPILVRRPETFPPAPAGPPEREIRHETPAAPERPGAPAAPAREREPDAARRPAAAPAEPPPVGRSDSGEPKSDVESPKEFAAEPVAPDARERRAAVARETARAGGEEEATAPPSAAAGTPLRLSFTAIDGFGAPPPPLPDVSIELPAAERGRQYVLLVDSQGSVKEVSPGANPKAAEPQPKIAASRGASSPLSRLRFQPGNRPRRLLVRIE